MPGDGAQTGLEECLARVVSSASKNDQDFWMTGCGCACWVNVVATKVADKLDYLLWRELSQILLPEGHHLALGNKKGQFILPLVRKLAQLNSLHFATDEWGERNDFSVIRQKVG